MLDYKPDLVTQASPGADLNWRTSSASAGCGECVEVAKSASHVLVRDSRNKTGMVLRFSSGPWRRFLSGLKNADGGDNRARSGLAPIRHRLAIL